MRYSSQQNSLVERDNWTIKTAMNVIYQTAIIVRLLAKVVYYFVYLVNKLETKLPMLTLYQIFTQVQLLVSHLRRSRSPSYDHVLNSLGTKFLSNVTTSLFIGYS